MIDYDTVLRARRLVGAAGEGSGCVGVAGGRIAAIAPLEADLDGRRVVELGDDVVLLPGLVDSHVHVNEPGRTEAEDAGAIDRAPSCHGPRYLDFLASRPRAAEHLAIDHVIQAARRTGARAHILHLSSGDALPMLAGARRDGIGVTAETCPHYLVLTAEEIPDGATQFKCCPPVREAANRELLWRGLADVVRWMAHGPARLLGLTRKGRIGVGYDADFCVFAPDEAFVVDPKRLHHKHPITPYGGRELLGVVHGTWLRGEELAGDEPRGRLLSRGGA
jgi:allantoinase